MSHHQPAFRQHGATEMEVIEILDDDDESPKSINPQEGTLMTLLGLYDRSKVQELLQECGHDVERAASVWLDRQERKISEKVEAKPKPLVIIEPPVPQQEEKVDLSPVYRTCLAQHLQVSPNEPFVDADFRPDTSSIDGRRHDCADSIVLCACGVRAAAKRVQSDGPNYGRFYLTCGKPAAKRASDTNASNVNPYAKRLKTSCNFFQWDKDGSKGAGYASARYAALAWQWFGPPYALYRHQPHPSHVRQGSVGNCWFLSALAVVAERPSLISQIVPQRCTNTVGLYQINFCLDGKWTPVLVDSHLPVVQDHKTAFCATPDHQLWPALVEKAYAKVHGSYAQLSGGFIAEGWQDLTGAPTETLVLGLFRERLDELWQLLQTFSREGFLMGVATSRGGDGLVGGHAYSVLKVYQIDNIKVGSQPKLTEASFTGASSQERETLRLVRIRNPWGQREWKGDFSADSDKWTRLLRQKLGAESFAKGDGTFFMSLTDMVHRFHHLDVAKTREGWKHVCCEGVFCPTKCPLHSTKRSFRLVPSIPTLAYITVIQPKKRSNTQSRYWYCDPCVLILTRHLGEREWKLATCHWKGLRRSSTAEIFLDTGSEYVCLPFALLATQNDQDYRFRLTCYSGEDVRVNPQPLSENMHSDAVRLLHNDLLGQKLKRELCVSDKCRLVYVHGDGCVAFIALNCSPDSFLSLKLTFQLPKDGIVLLLGKKDDSYDLAPRSQRVLAVLGSNGKLSNATHVSFRYMSSATRTVVKERTFTKSYLGGTLPASLLTDMLCSTSATITECGGDTLETYSWIPQLGTSSSLKYPLC